MISAIVQAQSALGKSLQLDVSFKRHNEIFRPFVPWLLHLCDETRQGDLADEGVADVQECTHASDESGPGNRQGSPERVASHSILASGGGVGGPGIVAGWVWLDSCENGGQQHRDEREACRSCAKLGERLERSGQGADPAEDEHDNGVADGSAGNIVVSGSHGVEVLCADKYVQPLDELGGVSFGKRELARRAQARCWKWMAYGVVEQEHDGREPPCPFLVPENHLTDITDITDLGMAQAELPEDQGTAALVRDWG